MTSPSLDTCPEIEPRLHVRCQLPLGHQGPHRYVDPIGSATWTTEKKP